MINVKSKHILKLLMVLSVSLLIISCASVKKSRKEMLYLQGNLDTLPNRTVLTKEDSIQKGDILNIIVFSDNPGATAIFNQPQSGSGAGGAGGYLVDPRGDIRFQSLGVVHVEGLTKLELMKVLDEKLKTYLTNPYTDVRIQNFKINLIGEVNRPGPFTIPEGRLTILEAVGLAGDLTPYGRRDNVLIIREEQGKRKFGRVDLRDKNLFQSEYFYLQQKDVILVEANKKKPTVDDQRMFRNLTLATTITGLITTFIFLFQAFSNNN
jgi:polysaccharide export outer membrane protein